MSQLKSLIGTVVILGILAGAIAFGIFYGGEVTPLGLYGTYPKLVAEDLDGQVVDIAELRGAPLLVLYVVERTSSLSSNSSAKVVEDYVAAHPEVRALVLARTREDGPPTFASTYSSLPVLAWDPDLHRGWGDWGGAAAPALYVLDADGFVVRTWSGQIMGPALTQLMANAPLGSRLGDGEPSEPPSPSTPHDGGR